MIIKTTRLIYLTGLILGIGYLSNPNGSVRADVSDQSVSTQSQAQQNSATSDQNSTQSDSNSSSDSSTTEQSSAQNNDNNNSANNDSSSTSQSNNSNNDNNVHHKTSPVHKYNKVTNRKKDNYYVNLKPGNYPIFKGGPKNTSKKNIKSIGKTSSNSNQRYHVIGHANSNNNKWVNIGGKWIKEKYLDPQTHYINVPLIGQRPQLPTGCEITAVTMMLRYKGVNVNKMQMAAKMPRSSNPNRGFIGNPKSPAGQLIYPAGLMNLVRHYAGSAKNMTGDSITKVKQQINRNRPVVVWVADVDNFPNHALTVYGYDHKYIYYNDPWLNRKSKMTYATMQYHRSHDGMRALSY